MRLFLIAVDAPRNSEKGNSLHKISIIKKFKLEIKAKLTKEKTFKSHPNNNDESNPQIRLFDSKPLLL